MIRGYNVGPLVFAGEATADNGEAGTVSGAILTGERASEAAQYVVQKSKQAR